LPLANQLFSEILVEAKRLGHHDILESDIQDYIALKSSINGRKLTFEDIDLESFVSYLDIEHYLYLKGKDHWNYEGNQSQILIRNLICKVLFEKQQQIPKQAIQLYDAFTSCLEPHDIIISFNYDTVLEASLNRNKKPFRYTLHRMLNERVIDPDAHDVVLLKMHGSIDWFDVSSYERAAEYFRDGYYFQTPDHPVFSDYRTFGPQRIGGLRGHYGSLDRVYRIDDLSKYLHGCQYISWAPLIISPSYAKMVYLNPLREFWRGFNAAGYLNPEMVVLGFSFSGHDDYLRIPLVRAITNFQRHNRLPEFGARPARLKLVDLKKSNKEREAFKDRIPFIDWERTDAFWDGLSHDAIHKVFQVAARSSRKKSNGRK